MKRFGSGSEAREAMRWSAKIELAQRLCHIHMSNSKFLGVAPSLTFDCACAFFQNTTNTNFNMAEDDTTKLRRLLETRLPQEVYEKIYEATFTVGAGVRHVKEIDRKLQCEYARQERKDLGHQLLRRSLLHSFAEIDNPSLLWVDKHSRIKVLDSFSGQPGTHFAVHGTSALHTMMKLVQKSELDKIVDIRLYCPDPFAGRWALRLLEESVPEEKWRVTWADKRKAGVRKNT